MLDFKIINEDGTLPTTTEQLSKILMSALERNSRYIEEPSSAEILTLTEFIARPDEFSLESLDPAILEGAAYYSKFDRLFDRGGMGVKIMNFHHFRDKVNDYQLANKISSLEKHQVQVGNLLIEYLAQDSQLTLLDSDCGILTQQVSKVFDFFVNVAATGRYELFEELKDETQVGSTMVAIESYLTSVKSADVYVESIDWKQRDDSRWSGSFVKREYPDSVKLYLNEGYAEETERRYFILENRAQTKPCL